MKVQVDIVDLVKDIVAEHIIEDSERLLGIASPILGNVEQDNQLSLSMQA